ncbi:hypothetical protein QCM80_29025 [Bradyrhizobium sp. SSUT112]|uniref:hypothetical protein n=1 Tax=Bradyrhizobium sp. SSUT112 TaxID=3040604 RepID=UPI00244990F3|nr:hypothetical protein [Bradyrhizobium sp. SSUT112]MDH2354679.1 hypothetical protein [Bradyrhizobium sp. SSUT112]
MSADDMPALPRDAVDFADGSQYQGHSNVFRLLVSAIERGATREVSHVEPGKMIKPDPIVASVSRQHCESLSRMRVFQKNIRDVLAGWSRKVAAMIWTKNRQQRARGAQHRSVE